MWERAYYGLTASVAGGLPGYICTVFADAAKTFKKRWLENKFKPPLNNYTPLVKEFRYMKYIQTFIF